MARRRLKERRETGLGASQEGGWRRVAREQEEQRLPSPSPGPQWRQRRQRAELRSCFSIQPGPGRRVFGTRCRTDTWGPLFKHL